MLNEIKEKMYFLGYILVYPFVEIVVVPCALAHISHVTISKK
jgi:hypothetical protein